MVLQTPHNLGPPDISDGIPASTDSSLAHVFFSHCSLNRTVGVSPVNLALAIQVFAQMSSLLTTLLKMAALITSIFNLLSITFTHGVIIF